MTDPRRRSAWCHRVAKDTVNCSDEMVDDQPTSVARELPRTDLDKFHGMGRVVVCMDSELRVRVLCKERKDGIACAFRLKSAKDAVGMPR